MNEVKRHFCWHQNFVPWGCLPLSQCNSLSCPPWTVCPPGGKLSCVILPHSLVIFTPRGQAVQTSLFCPPPIQGQWFNLMFSIYLQYTLIFTCFSEVIKMCSKGINCSSGLPLSEGWGASCPGWFILPPTQDLGQTVSSNNFHLRPKNSVKKFFFKEFLEKAYPRILFMLLCSLH